jgi:transcriptional regulator of arginine metabolism
MHKYANPSRAPRRKGTTAVGRRQALAELVAREAVGSQEDLVRLLKARGFPATQATVSRDLRSLGIGKRLSGSGSSVYAAATPGREMVDDRRLRLEIEAFVQEVKLVGNLALVRTPPGNANGVARALDVFNWPEVAGTIAGDDTILVVTRSAGQATRFRQHLSTLAGRSLA